MSSKCLLCGVNDYERWRWPCCSWCAYEVADDDLNKIEADVLNALGDIKPTFAVWKENTKNLNLPESQPAKVSPDLSLYIGDIDDAANVENLKSLEIGCVVSVCADQMKGKYEQLPIQLADAGIQQHIVCAWDREYFPIINVAEHVADAIDASLSKPQKNGVLIHCYAGVNRSAAVMIYFLTTRRELPLVTAIEQVMKKRGTILTNIGFQKQLVRHCFNNGLKLEGESGEVRGKRKADSLCMNEATTVHGDSLCMNDAATVRGSPRCPLRSDAVVVKRGDTVLTRVGQIRQPSSSIRTEPETETHVSVLNQLLTGESSGEAQKHRKRLRKAIRSEMHHTLHAPIGVVMLLLHHWSSEASSSSVWQFWQLWLLIRHSSDLAVITF